MNGQRELSRELRMGVKRDTPLIDLNGFDIIWSVPIEEFHLIKEGISKLMLERMFTGTAESVVRTFKKLSAMYSGMAVFSETSRRPREIKLKQFKGKQTLTF